MAQRDALPLCDGTNGVLGLDCSSVQGYPRKTEGRPWGPMNDAYPEGYPRYASRAQMSPANDEYPIIDTSSLPVCNGTNGRENIDCRPGAQGFSQFIPSLAQVRSGKEAAGAKDEAFAYPKSNGFDLPGLPECTGLNGDRKADCRQIGRWSERNWFAQMAKEEEKQDKDTAPNYGELTSGTPHLPECTGMNGDRKGGE